ncbi:MAG: ribonuclease HI family protein [candidate division WOR-3 bacterium]
MPIVNKIIGFIDGASKGNPGPSGIGVYFQTDKDRKLLQISKYRGIKTNNQIEYEALIYALKILKKMYFMWQLTNVSEIIINTDSELIFYQISGRYKVKNVIIKKLYTQAIKLMKSLPSVKLALIPRSKNKICDRLAKKSITIVDNSKVFENISNK